MENMIPRPANAASPTSPHSAINITRSNIAQPRFKLIKKSAYNIYLQEKFQQADNQASQRYQINADPIYSISFLPSL